MYVPVAVLKETLPHERRVALIPPAVPKLIKLGTRSPAQSGAGGAIPRAEADYKDAVLIEGRRRRVGDAAVVPATQPPALHLVDAIKEGAILAFAVEGKVKAGIEPQPLSAINDTFECLHKCAVASRVALDFDPASGGAAAASLPSRTHQRVECAMKTLHGYAITFSAIPMRGFEGEDVYRSYYAIRAPDEALIESIQGSVEHASKGDALDEAQVMGERRLSSLAADGVYLVTDPSWSNA